MPTNCYEKIAGDIRNDCRESYGKGMGQVAYYIYSDDVDFSASKMNGAYVISDIVLKSNARAVRINMPSRTAFTGTATSGNNPAIGTSYNKSFALTLMADSPKNAQRIDSFATNKGIVIFEHNAKGESGEQAFEVYGWENGLYAQDPEKDKYNEDSHGGWTVKLVEEDAKTSAIFFFKTDYETTKAALESMCDED